MKRIALFLIDVYRKYLSRLKGKPSCRFYPTCSAYTYTAISEWGFLIGVIMGMLRILRCNPLFRGGIDHVPLRGRKKRSAEGYTVYYSRTPEGYAPAVEEKAGKRAVK
ncbi:MAG: membrane protein insertion efficiency factor YidD [Clostridia bacterium]|nr:membrane protein insertion efficiency factor YidD [Clostridia bacterium]